MIKTFVISASLSCALPCFATGIDLPFGADLTFHNVASGTDVPLPTGAWGDGILPTERLAGIVDKSAWRIDAEHMTTNQIISPLRERLVTEGYDILLDCDTAACGGFDFRFNAEVLAEPNMHVNLGDFRVLTAKRETDGTPEAIYLIASKSVDTGFLQTISVTPETATGASRIVVSSKSPTISLDAFGAGLEQQGHAILADLVFETGSSTLGAESFQSLSALATYLNENPTRHVALVGHTDAEGSLNGNVGLSKKRAASVAKRLIDAHGVQSKQLAAEGMGYLAPRATNLTDEGRAQNRRVEVILTSTQQ